MFFKFLVFLPVPKIVKLKCVRSYTIFIYATTAGRSLLACLEDVPLGEFMYVVFTRMPGESYRRRLRSLLCLCGVFRVLMINTLAFCLFVCLSVSVRLPQIKP